MKITKTFECYPPTFTEEIKATGELVTVLYTDNVVITFPEIVEIKTPIMNGEEVIGYDITYKKVTCELVETEEGTVKQCTEVDYDGAALKAKVDTVVSTHDCTCHKTNIEIQEDNTAILWAEIQRLKGDI